MVQDIRVYRSSSTAVVAGTTSLAFGKLAFTDIGSVRRYYVGDSSNLAREIAGDAYARLASPAFTGAPTAPTAAPLNNSTQLATTAYVEAAVAAGTTPTVFDYKDSVRIASGANIANLAIVTVADFDGTGQGITLIAGDRVLVNHPSSIDGVEGVSAKRKGIYVVGTVVGPVAPLTRSTDADTSAEVTNGMTIANTAEGTYAGSRFVLVTADPIVLDTTSLTFAEQPNAGLTAGDGITITGGAIAVSTTAIAGAGLENDGSNNLRIAAAAAGAGLTGGAGSALAVGAGDGITVNADDIAVNVTAIAGTNLENDGSNNLRIAASAAGAGLTGGAAAALAVGAGDGITVNADDVAVNVTALVGNGIENDGSNNFRVKADVTTGATVAQLSVTANGAGVTVDNVSVIHTAGVLSVALVDGGTF